MGAIEAPRGTGHRLQQVGAPDRQADPDGLGGVHRALELASIEQAHLEPNAALGPFLARFLVGIEEIQIAGDHPDPLEAKAIKHESTSAAPARRDGRGTVPYVTRKGSPG